jgi:hypothetical protein
MRGGSWNGGYICVLRGLLGAYSWEPGKARRQHARQIPWIRRTSTKQGEYGEMKVLGMQADRDDVASVMASFSSRAHQPTGRRARS